MIIIDVVVDVLVGLVFGVGGKIVGNFVENVINNFLNVVKGKIGEMVIKIKYGVKGYKSNGNDVVWIGKNIVIGRKEVVKFDFDMENIFIGKKLIVESKFNKFGFIFN